MPLQKLLDSILITYLHPFYDIASSIFVINTTRVMANNNILKKTWCDLVFRHRNKDYGAYLLRKNAGRRYGIAIGCLGMLLIIMCVPVLIISWLSKPPVLYKDLANEIQRIDGVRLKEARPVRRQKQKSEPTPGEKNVNITDAAFIENMLVAETEDPVETEKIIDLPVDSLDVLAKEKQLNLATEEERTDGIIVDSIPHYPGGISSFMKWLDSVMVYPPACIREKIQGTVTVAFIIDTDGKMKDPRIISSSHRHLSNEVLRALHLMKPWKPAKKRGRAIKAQVTIPIIFEID